MKIPQIFQNLNKNSCQFTYQRCTFSNEFPKNLNFLAYIQRGFCLQRQSTVYILYLYKILTIFSMYIEYIGTFHNMIFVPLHICICIYILQYICNLKIQYIVQADYFTRCNVIKFQIHTYMYLTKYVYYKIYTQQTYYTYKMYRKHSEYTDICYNSTCQHMWKIIHHLTRLYSLVYLYLYMVLYIYTKQYNIAYNYTQLFMYYTYYMLYYAYVYKQLQQSYIYVCMYICRRDK